MVSMKHPMKKIYMNTDDPIPNNDLASDDEDEVLQCQKLVILLYFVFVFLLFLGSLTFS